MCSAVQFTYRCGCIQNTTFECPNTLADSYTHRHCNGLGAIITTTLDEDCYTCAGDTSTPAPAPAGVLQERPLNLPTQSSLTPIEDLLEDIFELVFGS